MTGHDDDEDEAVTWARYPLPWMPINTEITLNIDDGRKLAESINRFLLPEVAEDRKQERMQAFCNDLNYQFPSLHFSVASDSNPKIITMLRRQT